VEARVVDDGPGMSPEARLKATEPFWRGADTQNITGSGLGLTICVALVMRIGGQFELLDAQPHGLAAVVRLHKAVPAGVPGDQVTAGGFGVP
jgi:signal transduction histidine kinase